MAANFPRAFASVSPASREGRKGRKGEERERERKKRERTSNKSNYGTFFPFEARVFISFKAIPFSTGSKNRSNFLPTSIFTLEFLTLSLSLSDIPF